MTTMASMSNSTQGGAMFEKLRDDYNELKLFKCKTPGNNIVTRLHSFENVSSGARFDFTSADRFEIGRDWKNDNVDKHHSGRRKVRLGLQSVRISRRHCLVGFDDDIPQLTNIGQKSFHVLRRDGSLKRISRNDEVPLFWGDRILFSKNGKSIVDDCILYSWTKQENSSSDTATALESNRSVGFSINTKNGIAPSVRDLFLNGREKSVKLADQLSKEIDNDRFTNDADIEKPVDCFQRSRINGMGNLDSLPPLLTRMKQDTRHKNELAGSEKSPQGRISSVIPIAPVYASQPTSCKSATEEFAESVSPQKMLWATAAKVRKLSFSNSADAKESCTWGDHSPLELEGGRSESSSDSQESFLPPLKSRKKNADLHCSGTVAEGGAKIICTTLQNGSVNLVASEAIVNCEGKPADVTSACLKSSDSTEEKMRTLSGQQATISKSCTPSHVKHSTNAPETKETKRSLERSPKAPRAALDVEIGEGLGTKRVRISNKNSTPIAEDSEARNDDVDFLVGNRRPLLRGKTKIQTHEDIQSDRPSSSLRLRPRDSFEDESSIPFWEVKIGPKLGDDFQVEIPELISKCNDMIPFQHEAISPGPQKLDLSALNSMHVSKIKSDRQDVFSSWSVAERLTFDCAIFKCCKNFAEMWKSFPIFSRNGKSQGDLVSYYYNCFKYSEEYDRWRLFYHDLILRNQFYAGKEVNYPPDFTSLKDIIDAKYLLPGENVLSVPYFDCDNSATLLDNGLINFNGETFKSISEYSLYAKRLQNPELQEDNGWISVVYRGQTIADIRKAASEARYCTFGLKMGSDYQAQFLCSLNAQANQLKETYDVSVRAKERSRLAKENVGKRGVFGSLIVSDSDKLCELSSPALDPRTSIGYDLNVLQNLKDIGETRTLLCLDSIPVTATDPWLLCRKWLAAKPTRRQTALDRRVNHHKLPKGVLSLPLFRKFRFLGSPALNRNEMDVKSPFDKPERSVSLGPPEIDSETRSFSQRQKSSVSLEDLVNENILIPGTKVLLLCYRRRNFFADLLSSGCIKDVETDAVFEGNNMDQWVIECKRKLNPTVKSNSCWKCIFYIPPNGSSLLKKQVQSGKVCQPTSELGIVSNESGESSTKDSPLTSVSDDLFSRTGSDATSKVSESDEASKPHNLNFYRSQLLARKIRQRKDVNEKKRNGESLDADAKLSAKGDRKVCYPIQKAATFHFCICNTQYPSSKKDDTDAFFLRCCKGTGACNGWVHPSCFGINISRAHAEELTRFVCPLCSADGREIEVVESDGFKEVECFYDIGTILMTRVDYPLNNPVGWFAAKIVEVDFFHHPTAPYRIVYAFDDTIYEWITLGPNDPTRMQASDWLLSDCYWYQDLSWRRSSIQSSYFSVPGSKKRKNKSEAISK